MYKGDASLACPPNAAHCTLSLCCSFCLLANLRLCSPCLPICLPCGRALSLSLTSQIQNQLLKFKFSEEIQGIFATKEIQEEIVEIDQARCVTNKGKFVKSKEFSANVVEKTKGVATFENNQKSSTQEVELHVEEMRSDTQKIREMQSSLGNIIIDAYMSMKQKK